MCLGSVSSSPTHEQSAECDRVLQLRLVSRCGNRQRTPRQQSCWSRAGREEGGSTAIHLVAGAPGRSQEGRICTAAPPRPAQPGLGGITTEQRRGAEEQREFEGNTKLLFLRQQVQAAGHSHPPPRRCRQFAAAEPAAATQLLPPVWLTGRKVSMNRTNLISKVIIITRMMRRRYILTHT